MVEDIFRRRSIRLRGYDYAGGGMFFVTMCTEHMRCWFGEVVEGIMKLNEYGKVVEEEWLRTAKIRSNVQLDRYVVMPNHFHAILYIGLCRDMACHVHTAERRFGLPISHSLSSIIGSFKSAVSRRIHTMGSLDFTWQPRFYDHIIRREEDTIRIREYIVRNPLHWELDNNGEETLPW